jgi:hypothetical protein
LPPKTPNWLVCTLVALCTFAVTLKAQTASAEVAYAVTETNKLIRFDTGQAGQTDLGTITGTNGGEQILSIDFRPLNGRLYGVSATRLYTINPATAHASLATDTPFTTALAGNADMDFDPVSGLIRVVTDTNQNLRIDPDTGAMTTDTAISGVTGLAALGFTNSFASPDRSTLFGISPAANQLARIGGVNLTDGGASQAAGVATAIGGGGLGIDVDAPAGLDIAANDNEAFAVLTPAGDTQSGLYRISLITGAATFVRLVGIPERLRGLALVSRAVKLYALAQPTTAAPGGAIVSVLSPAPGTILAQPGEIVGITGLNASEEVVDIDTRPETGALVGLTNTGRLLNIDPLTGQTNLLSQVSIAVEGSVRAMDFNPVTNRLRIIGDNGQNLSVVPDTGVATEETDLDVTNLIAAGYDTAGVLYAMTSSDVVRFDNPSTGVSTPVSTHAAIFGPSTAIDISPVDGVAFIAQDAIANSSVGLFTLSLPDGGLSGTLGNFPATGPGGTGYRGLAVASPGRVRFSAADYSVNENAGFASIALHREAGSSGPISVQLTVAAGTATSPADFLAFNATVEFADGELTKVLNPPIVNDTADESDETVALTLSQPALGATIGTPAAATLTIVDNDPETGAAPTILILSPTADPAHTASSLFITLAGTAADSDGTVTAVAWSNDRGFSGTASTGTAAASIDWYATDVQLAAGVNTITVTATDNSGNLATDVIVVTVNDLSYYLAEGATGTFFDLDLLLANPNTTPVNITATFLKPLGQGTVVQHYTLPATSRTTINVEGIAGLENAEVSTIVTAPASTPIVVERTMRWNETGYGAHTDKASPSTSNKWYFAEGSQGFFFTYLLLANPHDAPNQVFVTYLREGASGVTRQYDLAPLQRFTVDLGADADLVNNSFGMEVTFTLPGIAERAMYFGLSPLWIGGHESVGVTQPSRSWFLAEGATGSFFETFVLFANPSTATANVSVRYLPDTGVPIDKTYQVPAGQRRTVNIQVEDPALANAAVATQVTSDVPIIVERAQYWPDPAPSWYEAHNSFGVTSTATRWGLAEGRVGLNTGYQTYILLANPNTNEVDVSITFLREDGTTLIKSFVVQPSSRFNVAVGGADVPEITNERFSAVVNASHPIAVERAMYSDQAGVTWQAGTNATATRLPAVP